ncbi:MAG: hypothetical protein FWF75_06590 [Propionibacteriaceae bacterium]|nr:hypothetical protein [Propionibacteriaceae bacterium]
MDDDLIESVPSPDVFCGMVPVAASAPPAHQVLVPARWRELEPDLAPSTLRRLLARTPSIEQAFWSDWLPRVLWRGAASAAVVMHVEPLIVAAYSPVFDTCAMLEFPAWLAAGHGQLATGRAQLAFGDHLVAVLAHLPGEALAPDLHLGGTPAAPAAGGLPDGWANVLPVVADFVCDPASGTLRQAHDDMPDWQWIRAEQCGREELWLSRGALRDGRPTRAAVPAGMDADAYPLRDLLLRSGEMGRRG